MVNKDYEDEWISCKYYKEMSGIPIIHCTQEECPYGNFQIDKDGLKDCRIKGRFDLDFIQEEIKEQLDLTKRSYTRISKN